MQHNKHNWLLWLLPTPGNIIFTLLIISGVIWAQSAGAITLGVINAPADTSVLIPYQGRLTDADGVPLSGKHTIAFSLYAEATGGESLWSEGRFGTQRVDIVDGLFNVMLGDVNPLPQSKITDNSTLYLGITIDPHEEMSPRVQLGAVPYAVHALSVPDGSITTEKLASNLIEGHIATTPQVHWDIPNCALGEAGDDTSWTAIPGAAIDFTLNKPKTIWLDFAGLGANKGSGQAIYSNIFINGTQTKLAAGRPDLSGCRNSQQDTSGYSWCSLSNITSVQLEAGTHTVEAKVWCDGNDGFARVYGGTLRGLILP